MFSSNLRILFATLFTLTAMSGAAHAQGAGAAAKAEPVSYYGVFMRTAKVGSAVIKRDDNAKHNGKPAVRTESTMTLDLALMGADVKTSTTSVSWSDPKSGKPLALTSRTDSAGRTTLVKATYTDRSVSYDADIQGETQKGTLELKDGEQFIFDTTSLAEFKPKPGLTIKGKTFVPDLLKLLDSEIQVIGEETIDIGGQSVKAFKIIEKNPMAPSTLYVNAAGDMLRMDSLMGIQLRRMSKEAALAAPGADTKIDLIDMVGITPTGEPLKDPRKLRSVRYEITGVTRQLAPQNNVQRAEYRQLPPESVTPETDKSERIAIVQVTTGPLPTEATVPLFKKAEDAPAHLRPYLKSTLYVPAGDAAFRKIARDVVGRETDAAKAAAKIAEYTHRTIKPDPSIAALRTAKDIKDDPRGVCRDYTTFFTAIARAAGLPTKQCVGMAYANGKFLYHAWPEVWVGKDASGADKWVALEPTWGAPYADATHIKLAEGEITDVFNVAADVGRYQVKVLSAE